MWYFLIRQSGIDFEQYRLLQAKATLTEVELYSEPYENWYVLSVEKDHFRTFADELDQLGIIYELTSERPARSDLLNRMRLP